MTHLRPPLKFSLRASVPLLALGLTSLASAQQTGGHWTTFHQWNGLAAADSFGSAVASAGDVDGDGRNDVIVGAPGASPNGMTSAGSVYVYSGITGALILQLDGSASGDAFGTAVASAGDLNADGISELLIGAPLASPAGLAAAGSVWVVDGATATTLFQYDGTATGDHLGQSVASLADTDGDSINEFLIGAPHADPSGLNDAGTAWLYSGATGLQIYAYDGAADGDWLGHCVAPSGDVNADGMPDFVLGAHGASPGGKTRAGSVYAYSGLDGTLIHQLDGVESGDYFGFSVSSAGDVNDDGWDDILVGAPNTVAGVVPRITGVVYAISGRFTNILLKKEGKNWFENFGWSVAPAGDVNLDGMDDIMVGAPLYQSGGVWHGAGFIFDSSTGFLIRQVDGSHSHSYMGYCVANLGDVTGAPFTEFAFAASAEDPGGISGAGGLQIHGVEALISADADSISVAVGGTVNFYLDFPDSSAGHDYRLLGSLTGTGPVFLNGLYIPLTPGDQAWRYMTDPVPPPWFTDSIGVLDANGDATVTMVVPVDQGPYFLGSTFYFAGVTLQLPSTPLISSIPVRVEFLP